MKEIYNIPEKMKGFHDPTINAIIDSWENMNVSFEDWKSTIYDIGITDYAPKHGVDTWVIDTSKGTGVFNQEIQDFRDKVARPKLVENGIKYFFVVSSGSALGKLSSKRTSKIYAEGGLMKSFHVESIEEAKQIRAEEIEKDQ